MQTAARDDEGENRLEQYGIGHGLSEVDFMARQRYLENSRYGTLNGTLNFGHISVDRNSMYDL